MSNEKISKRELFNALKCARCGSIEDIQSFESKFKQITNVKSYRRYTRYDTLTYTNEVPVCKNCNEKFRNYKVIRHRIVLGFIVLSITLSLLFYFTIFNGISGASYEEGFKIITFNIISLPIKAIPLIILFIVLGIISRRHKNRSKDNPSKYIRNLFGQISISPEDSENWYPYTQWAEMVLRERISQGTIDPTILEKLYKENLNTVKSGIFREKATIRELEMKSQAQKLQAIKDECPFCLNSLYLGRKECLVFSKKFLI